MLEYVWHFGGTERVVLTGFCSTFEFLTEPLNVNWEIAISRFAYLRREARKMTLESPEAFCQIEFTCLEPLYWFALFAQPVRVAALLETTFSVRDRRASADNDEIKLSHFKNFTIALVKLAAFARRSAVRVSRRLSRFRGNRSLADYELRRRNA